MLTAFVYAAIATAWILLSDFVVDLLPIGLQESIQSIKGVGFVLVTAIALYALIDRYSEQTEREAMRTAALERMLSQVVGTVPIGLVVTTDDGSVVFMNETAEKLLGVSNKDAVGHQFEQVSCGESADAALLGELLRVGHLDRMDLPPTDSRPARTLMALSAPVDPSVPASGYSIALAEISDVQRDRERLQRSLEGFGFLVPALEEAAHASEEALLLKRVAELAVKSGRYAAVWAVALDRDAQRYTTVARLGMGERTSEIAHFMEERAVANPRASKMPFGSVDEIMVANDVVRDPANVWHPAALEDSFGSTATMSIFSGGRLAGALTFFATEAGAFDAAELEMLRTLLTELSYAVGRMNLDRQRLVAEEASLGDHRAYHELFTHHPAPMWVYDLETLQFLAVNDAAVKKYGYSEDEFLAMTISDIRPKSEVPRLLSNVQSVAGGFEDAGVWTHFDNSGREFPVHIYSHTIDWAGRAAKLVMVMEVARIE